MRTELTNTPFSDLYFPVPKTGPFPKTNAYALSGDASTEQMEPSVAWALRAVHQQPTDFNLAFFGSKNVEYLQRRIAADVKKLTGFVIGRQSDEALMTIMIGLYIEYSENWGGNVEIERLNRAVLAECVKQVITGINAYSGYVRDASTTARPIPRPENPSIKGHRVLPGSLFLQKNA